ncbi:cysteine protease ATG4b isoform X1 [Brassica rapa]|uniref:cysteine protease ATG4b isoform X1 n=1 Tax=Brassica campestris TaxID=3711 RepID=UPI0004F15DB6|nr:cysteine protease ATG4b isoform X1 [Brassica rapa]XP_018510234.1 cysteine protease ATG4b isoform X1 [Brassica rapa]XP_018510236.1 cysteine protease ATG4b isoform X1 [Brassica rapa]XP_033135988.1 cysteine protease ATG4b isoform X1 [Brassica rapa]XP_033135989.1 cysteine protease ATG4b isoform X1 [Brassica rapa]
MKAICGRFLPSKCSSSNADENLDQSPTSPVSDSTLPLVSQTLREASTSEHQPVCTPHNDWTVILKTASMASGAIKRLQDRVLGPSRIGIPSSTSEIWLLGVCYKISESESSELAGAFRQDFSSLVLMTYRRGFEAIGDTTYTSDVNWGCMLRSGQMLFAQALLFQRLGRSWRKDSQPPEEEYLEILELFGDSEASAFSIHNLILAGESYGLAAGSWVGPYAVCRSWEALVRKRREETACSMAVHIVSGSEDGERGGAPILCLEDATKTCLEYSKGETEWTSVLLLVPLVLGLDKVNPRYIPSLIATFTFPQSLGILGGKPGASTYIVGVQEDKGFYLDPHGVQQVVTVNKETQDVDTSSYHCNTVRYVPLESLDPSLALGFYCRDKDDFDDFCIRATKLAGDSNGAPLFTVTKSHRTGDRGIAETSTVTCTCEEHEDEWQLL